MKEQINKLARGEFDYETPEFKVSDMQLAINIQKNQDYIGHIQVTSKSAGFKGICYSDNDKLKLVNQTFAGEESNVEYSIETKYADIDEIITGNICFVTNAGELKVPFSAKVVSESVSTNMGNCNTLFHFSNLFQSEPEVAVKLFVSDDFERIFLSEDDSALALYNSLKSSNDTMLAIEEFLIATKKKKNVTLHFNEYKREYGGIVENVKDTIEIKSDNWGYFNYSIESDADFIRVDEKVLSSDRFAGNKYSLEYLIDVSKLHAGKNWGRITFKGHNNTLTFDVFAWKSITDIQLRQAQKQDVLSLVSQYLSFRTKKINLNHWVESSLKVCEHLMGCDETDDFSRIYYAQLKLLGGMKEQGIQMLEIMKDRIREKSYNLPLYCYYLYVSTMATEDEKARKEMLEKVIRICEENSDDWRIFWIRSYMDPYYEQNVSLKLATIKTLFYNGCNSPIIYYEAVSCFNEMPYLLRVLDEFEFQVLMFGCKYGACNENLIKQLCDLYRDGKVKNPLGVNLLIRVYELNQKDEILEMLCTTIISMHLTDKKYTEILELGISKGLRIARLYETYMETRDEHDYSILPKMVLLYFSYNNALDSTRKASLYANIILNKLSDMDTYHTYLKLMEKFAYDQMELTNISQNLAIIYKEFWNDDIIEKTFAPQFSRLLFAYKLTCHHDDIQTVYVCHKEVQEMTQARVINGVAYVLLYTDNVGLVFEDSYGRRYSGSIQYELEKLLSSDSWDSKMKEIKGTNNMLYELHLLEKAVKFQYPVRNLFELMISLYKQEELGRRCKEKLASLIVTYFYERFDGENFEELYDEFITPEFVDMLSVVDGVHLAECCVMHGMLDEAYNLAIRFGCDKMYPPRLMRLCRGLITQFVNEKDDNIIKLCYKSFKNRKYDAMLLEYLAQYFNGSTEEMVEVWEATKSFDIDAYELEERLIAQMLFVNSDSTKMETIFDSYSKKGAKEKVVAAFLSFHAYRYFVKKIIPKDNVIKMLEVRLCQQTDLPLVWKVALLKYYSDMKRFSEEQKLLASILLEEQCAQNRIFGFYKKFLGIIPLPFNIIDKTYIEYRTNPKYRVFIHYLKENESEDYITEEMTDVYEGVFTKEFLLFYGETIQYYITEKYGDEENVTESKSVMNSKINPDFSEGRFDCINDLLSCQELHDMVTLKKLMQGYAIKNYAAEQLFKPM